MSEPTKDSGSNLSVLEDQDAPVQSPIDVPQDLLLVIFIHGFKGTDSTFGKYPERLQHVLSETIRNVHVESVVFPAYETKGDLNAAVIRFADWLTNLTVEREVASGLGGGAGKAKIVLCGHSMGGLLAADALIEFVRTRPDQSAPLWPNIIACLAYDTPYFGLNPSVFKNSADQVAGHVKSAADLFSATTSFFNSKPTGGRPTSFAAPKAALPAPPAQASGGSVWSKWAPAAYAVGGALLAGAAAGTAYYKREDITGGYAWATDHMKYVGTLWDEATLHKRVSDLLQIEEKMGVMFRTFYTYLPASPPTHRLPRTFIILPKSDSHYESHFLQAPNSIAGDEIEAHTGMFDGKTNDGYYELGLISAQLIRDVMVASRSTVEGEQKNVAMHPPGEEGVTKLEDDEGAKEATEVAQAEEAAERAEAK